MTKWILIIWAFSFGAPNDFEVIGTFSYENDCVEALDLWKKSRGDEGGPEGLCLKVNGMDPFPNSSVGRD